MPSCSTFRPHRIAEAVQRRAPLAARTDLDAYRLFHGVAEGIPGLAVDRFAEVAVVHADSSDLAGSWVPVVHQQLADIQTAYLKIHPSHASRVRAPDLQRLSPPEPVWGPARASVQVVENGLHYVVRPAAGLSPGLFLDMRDVRAWLVTAAQGKSVLNLFSYTCSLGVCAASGGAQRVLNVDLSRAYLEAGKTNYQLNGLPIDDHDFVHGDAFDWLARFARRQAAFDLVIVDPPTYSSTPFSVTRDYPRLVSLAARVVAPAGILLAATNHTGTSDTRFGDWLRAGLSMANRHGQLVQRWHEPHADFPLAAGRGPYLKVRALVLD